MTPRNALAHWTSALAQRMASDLAAHNWQLETVMNDNASEFRSREFEQAVQPLRAQHLFIRVAIRRTTPIARLSPCCAC